MKYCLPPEDFDIPLPDNWINARDPQLNEEEMRIARTMPDNYLSVLISAMKHLEGKDMDMFGAFSLVKLGVIPGKILYHTIQCLFKVYRAEWLLCLR